MFKNAISVGSDEALNFGSVRFLPVSATFFLRFRKVLNIICAMWTYTLFTVQFSSWAHSDKNLNIFALNTKSAIGVVKIN